jgi:hypothetical protein
MYIWIHKCTLLLAVPCTCRANASAPVLLVVHSVEQCTQQCYTFVLHCCDDCGPLANVTATTAPISSLTFTVQCDAIRPMITAVQLQTVLAAADNAVTALHVISRRVTPPQLQLLALPLAALQQYHQSSTKPAAVRVTPAAAVQQQQQQQQLVIETETEIGDAPVTVTLITGTASGTARNVNRSALRRCHGVLTTDGATAVCLALTRALTHAVMLALMHALMHAAIRAVTRAGQRMMTELVLLLVAVRSSSV